MQNVLAHGTPPRSGVVAGSLIAEREREREREGELELHNIILSCWLRRGAH
jgi:hypothetical protein